MIGADTNILVRYLIQDDELQTTLANHFLEKTCSPQNPAFVTFITIAELFWVLRTGYKLDKALIIRTIETLLVGENIVFEDDTLIWKALYEYDKGSADFTDYLIAQINQQHGCIYTATVDKKAGRSRLFHLLT